MGDRNHGRPYLAPVDDHVPELRRSRQPLPMWVRSLAFILGASSGVGAGVAGVVTTIAPAALRAAGVSLAKDVDAKFEAAKRDRDASDKVIEGKFADVAKRLDTLQSSAAATSRAVQSIGRQVTQMSKRVPRNTQGVEAP